MNTFKGTPGPWKAHFNVPTAVIEGHIIKADDSAQTPIATVYKGGGINGQPRQIANAKLIAAAPQMMEALQNYIQAVNDGEIINQFDELKAALSAALD